MTDFPQGRAPVLDAAPTGVVVSNAGPMSPVGQHLAMTRMLPAGGAWPANNEARYQQVLIPETVTAYQMSFEVTTQSGNYDIGIYSEDGTRLVSTGSTAVPAAGFAIGNIADTVLTPGVYWLALCMSTTAAAVSRINTAPGAMMSTHGTLNQAVGAVTLPNPATFAQPTTGFNPWIAVYLSATTV